MRQWHRHIGAIKNSLEPNLVGLESRTLQVLASHHMPRRWDQARRTKLLHLLVVLNILGSRDEVAPLLEVSSIWVSAGLSVSLVVLGVAILLIEDPLRRLVEKGSKGTHDLLELA